MGKNRPVTIEAPTREETIACQFNQWYHTFRNIGSSNNNLDRKSATVRSTIISLSRFPDFITYLLSDGCVLPPFAKSNAFLDTNPDEANDFHDSDQDHQSYDFEELNDEIEASIARLGGSVMPKLNWSSPKDASWINRGTLKCHTAGDVFLLLKSSDFIVHDLLYTVDGVKDGDSNDVEFHLVLRKWCNLYPSMEYRCFVAHHELVCISQRNHSQYYPYLQQQKVQIVDDIYSFFSRIVQRNFASGTVDCYVFDVYIDKSRAVWLLDFNTWSLQTDSLLFQWDELNLIRCDTEDKSKKFSDLVSDDGGKERPEIRLVDASKEVHPDPLSSYRAPVDAIDLAADSTGSNSFAEFMAMCERPTANHSFSDED